jgi:hypothetical protein
MICILDDALVVTKIGGTYANPFYTKCKHDKDL